MVKMEIQAHLDNLPSRLKAFGAAQTLLNFMEDAHLDGWQVPPHHTPPTHMYRLDSLAHAGAVTSLFRPWSYGVGLQEQAYRLVPGLGAPVGRIADMQAKLLQNGAHERVPTVLQTNDRQMGSAPVWHTDYRKLRKRGVAGPMVCQLGAQTLLAWDIDGKMAPAEAAEVSLRTQKERGFDGTALDLRSLEGDEQFAGWWAERYVAWYALRGGLRGPKDYGCSEVVVSLPPNAAGKQDARKIIVGELAQTRVGRLLQIILHNVQHDHLRGTVHASPATFRRLGGYRAGNKAVSLAMRRLRPSALTVYGTGRAARGY